MDADILKANIEEAQARVDAALAEYEAAQAELEWWKDGLRVFAPQEAEAGEDESTSRIPELVGAILLKGDERPSLRRAILHVIQQTPTASWEVRDIATALAQKGWLPESEPTKRISDVAGLLVRDKILVRRDRGTYALAPELAASMNVGRSFTGALLAPKVSRDISLSTPKPRRPPS